MVGQGHRSIVDNQIVKMAVTVQPSEAGLLQLTTITAERIHSATGRFMLYPPAHPRHRALR